MKPGVLVVDESGYLSLALPTYHHISGPRKEPLTLPECWAWCGIASTD